MKTFQYLSAGTILFCFLIFQGCQNCDEAVSAAKSGFDSKLTAATDSLKGAWKADIDAIRATYETKINSLDSLIAAMPQAKTGAKKTVVPVKKEETKLDPKKAKMAGEKENTAEEKKAKMSGDDQKQQESLDKKKSKISGGETKP